VDEGVNVTRPVLGHGGSGIEGTGGGHVGAASDGACALTPAARLQRAAERLVEALHELALNQQRGETEQTLDGVIAGTQAALQHSLENEHQLATSMWDAIGEMAWAIQDQVEKGVSDE
jgi:HAMP domain-containing protein